MSHEAVLEPHTTHGSHSRLSVSDTARIDDIVVVGAGQAGAQAIMTLRECGYSERLTLVGEERWAPYQRPPLSKSYLEGTADIERISLRDDGFYRQLDCTLILGVSVSSIDRESQYVALESRGRIRYDRLLLATGASARSMNVPGSGLPGVFYLRNLRDADSLRCELHRGRRLAIIGGGYVGLEVAAVASKLGVRVAVFEACDRPMSRVASRTMSEYLSEIHRAAGVSLFTSTNVARFVGTDRLEGVAAGGEVHSADLALIGVGSVPNEKIGRMAGLATDDGILVNEFATTSDPRIFAAGDCTRHPSPQGDLYRLESVQNAVDQAKHAAYAMLGKPRPYAQTPWFWSEQYGTKLQMAGRPGLATSQVIRGERAEGAFSIFHLLDEAVVAVESVNSPMDYMAARKLIGSGAKVNPARLADASIPIRSFV